MTLQKMPHEEPKMAVALLNFIKVEKSRKMRRVGHMTLVVDKRTAYTDLVEKCEEKYLYGRPRHRCEDNMKVYLN